MNDVNRLRILQDVIDRRLTTRLVTSRLEISDRHCRRLLERYREQGSLSLANLRHGCPGNHRLPESLKLRVLSLLCDRYSDFGPTLTAAKLNERHDITNTQKMDYHRLPLCSIFPVKAWMYHP